MAFIDLFGNLVAGGGNGGEAVPWEALVDLAEQGIEVWGRDEPIPPEPAPAPTAPAPTGPAVTVPPVIHLPTRPPETTQR